jgi:hypothetical protein
VDYVDYVDKFIQTVDPDVLTADIYPFFEGDDDDGPASRAGYRANLAVLRRASLAAGAPSPGRCCRSDFALCVSVAFLYTKQTPGWVPGWLERPRPGVPFWTMFNTMPFAGHALAKGSEAILLQAAPLYMDGP